MGLKTMNDEDGISGAGFQRAKWSHLKIQMQEEIGTDSVLKPIVVPEAIHGSGKTLFSLQHYLGKLYISFCI